MPALTDKTKPHSSDVLAALPGRFKEQPRNCSWGAATLLCTEDADGEVRRWLPDSSQFPCDELNQL